MKESLQSWLLLIYDMPHCYTSYSTAECNRNFFDAREYFLFDEPFQVARFVLVLPERTFCLWKKRGPAREYSWDSVLQRKRIFTIRRSIFKVSRFSGRMSQCAPVNACSPHSLFRRLPSECEARGLNFWHKSSVGSRAFPFHSTENGSLHV